MITSGFGVAYAADTEHVGTLEVGSPSNIASGDYSAAFGDGTTASGWATTTFGHETEASAEKAVAFGDRTTASGSHSAAFGGYTTASGHRSVSFGTRTTASGSHSAAFGYSTTAQPYSSFVIGKHNEISGTKTSWITTEPLFVIGNGADASNLNNAVTVLKNGNVGIGVSAPTQPLQVNGIIESTTSGFKFPDGTTQTTASIDTTLDQTDIEAFGFVTGNNTGSNLWTQSGSDLSYTTGNVGIGTTTSSEKLHISELDVNGYTGFRLQNPGQSNLELRTYGDSSSAWRGASIISSWNTDVDLGLVADSLGKVNAGTSDHVIWLDASSGNVGIGTTTPNEKLEVSGIVYTNTESSGFIADESNRKRVGLMKYEGHEAGIWRASSQDFAIGRTSGSDITTSIPSVTDLYVDGSGNVGIGTTNPSVMLTVGPNPSTAFNGNELFQVAKTGDAYMTIRDGTANALLGTTNGLPFVGSQSNHDFTIRTNNDEKVRITSDGNVGIGTNSPNSELEVVGYIQLDTNTGTPTSADCDTSNEYGRMIVDDTATSSNLYVCTPSGWATK